MSADQFLAPIGALPALDAAASALNSVQTLGRISSGAGSGAAGRVGFADLVTQGLQQVNHGLLASQADMQGLAAGGTENLHQMMIRLEESRLSFQLMVQVRNRVLESYQELMRMQV